MRESRRFLRFLLAGGAAALVNWTTRILYSLWVDFSVAVAAAYLTGMVAAFILYRSFVFEVQDPDGKPSIASYVLVNLLGFSLTWALSVALGLHLFPAIGLDVYPLEIAHAIAVAAPVITTYLGHRHFTFR